MAKTLSSSAWVSKFPDGGSTDDLADPFKANAKKFIAAMEKAGAKVDVQSTLRPKERAYLMLWSFKISNGLDPEKAPEMAGVDIEWVHRDSKGVKNVAASKTAADMMVAGYDIAFEPSPTSHHLTGNAIDMVITWTAKDLKITDGSGKDVTINTGNKGGSNPELHKVGASYSVFKLVRDPPHWSVDGH